MQDLSLPQPVELAQLIMRAGPGEVRERVQYVGALEGYSVLVTHPMHGHKPILLTLGDRLTVRIVSGRSVLTFSTTVMRLCSLPARYVHLAWPRQIGRQLLRRHHRVSTNISGRAEFAERSQPVQIRNLSLDGARLEGLSDATPGEEMQLHFDMPIEGRPEIAIPAIVRNCSHQAEVVQLGVQFVDLPAETRGRLAEFLLQEEV